MEFGKPAEAGFNNNDGSTGPHRLKAAAPTGRLKPAETRTGPLHSECVVSDSRNPRETAGEDAGRYLHLFNNSSRLG